MRLRRPNLVPQLVPTVLSSPFTSPPLAQLSESSVINPVLEGSGLTGLGAIPTGFGTMVVGTHFLAYVCLNNESDNDVTDIQVVSELRIPNNPKIILQPSVARVGTAPELVSEEGQSFTLKPGEAIHMILDHSLHSPNEWGTNWGRSCLSRGSYARSWSNLFASHGIASSYISQNV
jgi:hypothetical protein